MNALAFFLILSPIAAPARLWPSASSNTTSNTLSTLGLSFQTGANTGMLTAQDARAFLSALHGGATGDDNAEDNVGHDCATIEVMQAEALLRAENPTHSLISDFMIHGPTADYYSANFHLIYATDPTSTDAPVQTDADSVYSYPDGTTFTTAKNGTPDYVEAAANQLEYARAHYAAMGFQVAGPGLEVRLVNVQRSYSLALIGITLNSKSTFHHLPFLCSHELFHQVQWTYTPGDLSVNVVRLQNPAGYDTFGVEATAQAAADMVTGLAQWGSDTRQDANDYLSNTDIDFWNQSYSSSELWEYLMQQYSAETYSAVGSQVGHEVLRAFWQRRGVSLTTSSALNDTLAAYGTTLDDFLDRYRVAIAVKGYLQVDTTVPGPLRPYDFLDDALDTWNPVALVKTVNLDDGADQVTSTAIQNDRGAQYIAVKTGHAQSVPLRLVGASTDLRLYVAQVFEAGSDRHVQVDKIIAKDGVLEQTVAIQPGNLAAYVIVASTNGTQPYELVLNPTAATPVPKLSMQCGAMVPLGTPESGRDAAAAIQVCGLVAVMLLAVRRYRRRQDP